MSATRNIFDSFPWINLSFVQTVIENSEQSKQVALKSFTANKCFEGGESFSSTMIALTVVYDDGNGNEKKSDFLVKIALQTKEYIELCKESLIYEKEIETYTKILPAIERALAAKGVCGQIAPRCFRTDLEKRVLVFEDLRSQGFGNVVDKAAGLDMDQMKMTLSNLAKWHAGTATLLLTNIDIFEWHKKKIFYIDAPKTERLFKDIAKTISNAIADWSGHERIAEKIRNIPQEAFDNIYKSYVPQDGGFNVITHGDMYINNLLFRYDENQKPVDTRLIDFQYGQHASPTNDLFRLLYAAPNTSIKWKHREYLIQHYHEQLIKNLKLMGFPGKMPTLQEIQVEAFRTDFYNALAVLFIMGLRFFNHSFDGGFLEVADGNQLYTHPECIRQVKILLDIFDRRGYFDF